MSHGGRQFCIICLSYNREYGSETGSFYFQVYIMLETKTKAIKNYFILISTTKKIKTRKNFSRQIFKKNFPSSNIYHREIFLAKIKKFKTKSSRHSLEREREENKFKQIYKTLLLVTVFFFSLYVIN